MRQYAANILLPTAAIAAALGLFGVFVAFAGASPVEAWIILFKGAFGDWFSWQNTLQRAAPLMLTALCVAIPALILYLFFVGRVDMLVTEIDRHGQDLVNLISAEAIEDRRNRPPRASKVKKVA